MSNEGACREVFGHKHSSQRWQAPAQKPAAAVVTAQAAKRDNIPAAIVAAAALDALLLLCTLLWRTLSTAVGQLSCW